MTAGSRCSWVPQRLLQQDERVGCGGCFPRLDPESTLVIKTSNSFLESKSKYAASRCCRGGRKLGPLRRWRVAAVGKSDLQARPVYHRKRDSIEAHLTIVFAALAVSHWIETTTGWSIRKFVRTARRYRTITSQAGPHIMTAANPVPDDLRTALTKINNTSPGAH